MRGRPPRSCLAALPHPPSLRPCNTRLPHACMHAGGGEVHVLSAMHASGEQLNQLTGVAAVLRFPLPDLEDQELAEPDDDGGGGGG